MTTVIPDRLNPCVDKRLDAWIVQDRLNKSDAFFDVLERYDGADLVDAPVVHLLIRFSQ